MKYLKTFEGFVDPVDADLKMDYEEIASVIAEGFKKDDIKIKEKIYYNDKVVLVMDIEFPESVKLEDEKNILSKVKSMLAAFSYNDDFKCSSVKTDDRFIIRVVEK